MSEAGGLETYTFLGAITLVGGGVYGLLRPHQIAQRNRDHVDSGEERFFEERRAWKHYGTPPTSAVKVRRVAVFCILVGIAGLLLNSPFSSVFD